MYIELLGGYAIRPGKQEDVKEAYRLIIELAVYERSLHEVEHTLEEMEADFAKPSPGYQFLVCERRGEIVGLSLYYEAYSTWKGRCLYLEDLIVTQAHRGNGLGKALFEATARLTRDVGAKRLMWQVLDWNKPAIDFYTRMGAVFLPEWLNARLTKESLELY